METISAAVSVQENKFAALKIKKLEEALTAIRAKVQLHSSYQNIRHLVDKEKELADMLHVARQQYIIHS